MKRAAQIWSALVLGLMLGVAQANPVLLVNGAGKLVGATGVSVNGIDYDVAFVDGTCAGVFGACDQAHFTFTTSAQAGAAAAALMSSVFVGAFDSSPQLTMGCSVTANQYCAVLTPYATIGSPTPSAVLDAVAYNFASEGGDGVAVPDTTSTVDFSSIASLTWAVWSPSPVATPASEPGVLSLMGLGLLGLWVRRRQVACRPGR